MSGPHVPYNPDPLHVAEREADAWDAGYAAAVHDHGWVGGLFLAALSGAIVGALAVVAVVALR